MGRSLRWGRSGNGTGQRRGYFRFPACAASTKEARSRMRSTLGTMHAVRPGGTCRDRGRDPRRAAYGNRSARLRPSLRISLMKFQFCGPGWRKAWLAPRPSGVLSRSAFTEMRGREDRAPSGAGAFLLQRPHDFRPCSSPGLCPAAAFSARRPLSRRPLPFRLSCGVGRVDRRVSGSTWPALAWVAVAGRRCKG